MERTTCNQIGAFIIGDRLQAGSRETPPDSQRQCMRQMCEPIFFSHFYYLLIRIIKFIIIDLHNECIQMSIDICDSVQPHTQNAPYLSHSLTHTTR